MLGLGLGLDLVFKYVLVFAGSATDIMSTLVNSSRNNAACLQINKILTTYANNMPIAAVYVCGYYALLIIKSDENKHG